MSSQISPRVHIGEVIRNAVMFRPNDRQDASMNPDSLVDTVARFFSVLRDRQIDYVLVGGVALLQYVEGRNTEDVDLIMPGSALERMPELVIETADEDFARAKFSDLRVDVLLTTNALFEKVRRGYVTERRFVEQDIPCATIEGLILLKLYALPSLYRQGNFARVGLYENDVATLLQKHNPPVEPLLEELSHYLSASDLSVVQQIVAEIQRRISRFDERNSTNEPG